MANDSSPTRQIALLLEYDGTEFSGWQIQPNARTVQGVVEEALADLTSAPTRVAAAGRTDAGVHARGQVAAFTTSLAWDTGAFEGGLRARLPEDVGILKAWEAPLEFDPRRDAIRRTYSYRLWNRRVPPVMERRFWTHFPTPLDFGAIREASGYLVGDHDFAGFRSAHCGAKRTRLTLERLEWLEKGDGRWVMEIACRSFLHHMVRTIVGTLIEVGRGAMAPDEVDRILETGDRGLAGPTARPEGLTLERVDYP